MIAHILHELLQDAPSRLRRCVVLAADALVLFGINTVSVACH